MTWGEWSRPCGKSSRGSVGPLPPRRRQNLISDFRPDAAVSVFVSEPGTRRMLEDGYQKLINWFDQGKFVRAVGFFMIMLVIIPISCWMDKNDPKTHPRGQPTAPRTDASKIGPGYNKPKIKISEPKIPPISAKAEEAEAGTERVKGTHPERIKGIHLDLQNSRPGQKRRPWFSRPSTRNGPTPAPSAWTGPAER